MTISCIEKGRKIEYHREEREQSNVSDTLWVDISQFFINDV